MSIWALVLAAVTTSLGFFPTTCVDFTYRSGVESRAFGFELIVGLDRPICLEEQASPELNTQPPRPLHPCLYRVSIVIDVERTPHKDIIDGFRRVNWVGLIRESEQTIVHASLLGIFIATDPTVERRACIDLIIVPQTSPLDPVFLLWAVAFPPSGWVYLKLYHGLRKNLRVFYLFPIRPINTLISRWPSFTRPNRQNEGECHDHYLDNHFEGSDLIYSIECRSKT